MDASQVAEKRRDTKGRWHSVAAAPCEDCGCLYDYSLDEPGVVWEAGARVDDNCLDELCECHLMSIQGLPFKLNLAS